MKKLSVFILVVLAFVVLVSTAAPAVAETNFSISPPPIASPSFEAGKGYMKFRASYVTIEAPGFELSGAGIDFVPRQAINDFLAWDANIGIFGMSGEMEMDTGAGIEVYDMTMSTLRFGFNLEVQPLSSDIASMLLFFGPAFDFTFGLIEMPATCFMGYCLGGDTDLYTTQYGILLGLQGGVQAGDFHIDAYVMSSSMAGDTEITDAYGNSTTSTIDSYTTTSIGLDVEYTPWRLTLSSLMQEADDSGDSNGAEVEIYQIGWRKDF